MSESLEVTPQQVEEKRKAGTAVHLIDVREPEEYAVARIEGAELIPMRNVPAALQQLETKADEGELLVFCHHGVRSLQVAHWLRENGLSNAYSVAGGIDRWSLEIDNSVPRY